MALVRGKSWCETRPINSFITCDLSLRKRLPYLTFLSRLQSKIIPLGNISTVVAFGYCQFSAGGVLFSLQLGTLICATREDKKQKRKAFGLVLLVSNAPKNKRCLFPNCVNSVALCILTASRRFVQFV